MDPIQWYPGHIALWDRQLDAQLKWVDLTVIVLDARIPQTTLDRRLLERLQRKPCLLLLNKSDLADPGTTRAWQRAFEGEGLPVAVYDALSRANRRVVIDKLLALGETKWQQLEAQGRKRRPLRVLIAGMPNVGKSSIINSWVGARKAQTGNKAGVTRQTQWIRIHPQLELLDSPGVIPPKLQSPEAGMALAAVNSLSEASYEEEVVATFLVESLPTRYGPVLQSHYRLAASDPVVLETLAIARGFLITGGQPDRLRMAKTLLQDFRQGRLGRLSLEEPDKTAAANDAPD